MGRQRQLPGHRKNAAPRARSGRNPRRCDRIGVYPLAENKYVQEEQTVVKKAVTRSSLRNP